MKEIKLKSGATLGLQLAAFEDGMALLDAILREMIGVKMELEGETLDLRELAGKNLWQLKDALFKVIASKDVKAALWTCLSSCTYALPGKPGERIDRTTFESEKTRGDFFPVAGEVTAFNLAPFFGSLSFPSSLQRDQPPQPEKPPGPGTG